MEILDLRSRYIDCRHAGMSRQHSQPPGSVSEVGVMQCIMYIIYLFYLGFKFQRNILSLVI